MASFMDKSNNVDPSAYPPRGTDLIQYDDENYQYGEDTLRYDGWDTTKTYPIPRWKDKTT